MALWKDETVAHINRASLQGVHPRLTPELKDWWRGTGIIYWTDHLQGSLMCSNFDSS